MEKVIIQFLSEGTCSYGLQNFIIQKSLGFLVFKLDLATETPSYGQFLSP